MTVHAVEAISESLSHRILIIEKCGITILKQQVCSSLFIQNGVNLKIRSVCCLLKFFSCRSMHASIQKYDIKIMISIYD